MWFFYAISVDIITIVMYIMSVGHAKKDDKNEKYL